MRSPAACTKMVQTFSKTSSVDDVLLKISDSLLLPTRYSMMVFGALFRNPIFFGGGRKIFSLKIFATIFQRSSDGQKDLKVG